MSERFYLLKIQLLDIEPSIWRRFVVPASITLDRLHDVIQIVMGWTDSHLHEFTIGNKRYTEYPESKEDGLACGRYRLGDLLKQKGRTFRYLYDFGDGWEHELVLEESRYFNPELRTEMACLDGQRACPPEDVGGHYFCSYINSLWVKSKVETVLHQVAAPSICIFKEVLDSRHYIIRFNASMRSSRGGWVMNRRLMP